MKKVVRMHLVEHAKTMAGTVREAYGEVPGRVQETLFSERGAKASSEGSREGSRRIFHDFGCPLGFPWGSISDEKAVFFRALILVDFDSNLGRGRRQGADPGTFRICRNRKLLKGLLTPGSPFGGAANLRASPPAAGPLSTGSC